MIKDISIECIRYKDMKYDVCIPDICHFFYTGKIFRDNILHPKARK